jgi:hypothetical protein
MCLQKPFDCWLKKVWQILMKDVTDAFLVAHLKELEILVKDTQEPYLTFEGARHVASITTLSVAGEILDEYQAIVDTEQNEKIRLSPLGWGRRDEWTKEKIPSGLPTLAMVLAKHH